MNKKEQAILIWVLAAAAMLLLLLYSPWGSPDMYYKRVYFSDNQGVNFENRTIFRQCVHVGIVNSNVKSLSSVVNAPKKGSVGPYQNSELNVPDNYSKRKKANKISSTKNSGANLGSNRIIAYNKISKSSVTKKRGSSTGGSATSNTVGSSYQSTSSSTGSFASNRNNNSFVGGALYQSAGIISTGVDLSLFSDSTTVEVMDSAQKASQADENIPVPDGWGFLLALAVIYIGFKRKIFFQLIEKKSIN